MFSQAKKKYKCLFLDCACTGGICKVSITNKITDADRFFTLYLGDLQNPPFLMDQYISVKLEYDDKGTTFDEIKSFLLPRSLFKQGDITSCSLVQNSYKVSEITNYTFSFSPSNKIFRGGKININFPTEIKLNPSLNILVKLYDQTEIKIDLLQTASDRIILDMLFSQGDFEIDLSKSIIINVFGVKNPDVISSAGISLSTTTSDNYVIDQVHIYF